MAFAAAFRTHAIEEVGFRVLLNIPFSNEMLQKIAADEELNQTLPRSEISPLVEIVMQPDGKGGNLPVPREAGLAAVTLDSAKPDGTSAWRLRAEGSTLEIKCRDYLRWAPTWRTALNLFRRTLLTTLSEELEIQAISLHYIDLFVWNGATEDYDLEQLFIQDSEYLFPSILKRGPVWHLHQGWFEPSPLGENHGPDSEILRRIHINGIRKNGQPVVRVEQFSQIQIRPRAIRSSDFFSSSNVADLAGPTFDGLHHFNKKIMVKLLRPIICDEIGLKITTPESEIARRIAG